MSDKTKSAAKLIGGLLALLGSAFGASEAGVMPDLQDIDQLGGLTSLLLIVYLHLVWFPLVKRASSQVEAISATVGAGALVQPEPEAEDSVPQKVAVPRTGPTHVVKPVKP